MRICDIKWIFMWYVFIEVVKNTFICLFKGFYDLTLCTRAVPKRRPAEMKSWRFRVQRVHINFFLKQCRCSSLWTQDFFQHQFVNNGCISLWTLNFIPNYYINHDSYKLAWCFNGNNHFIIIRSIYQIFLY